MSVLNIRDFDDDLHRRARIAAAHTDGGSIKAVVTEAVSVLLAIPEDVRSMAQAKAESGGESLGDLVARAVARELAQ